MKKILFIYTIILVLSTCVSIKTKKNVAIDYYNLGNDYLEVKNYKKAIESFNKSLEYDQKSTNTILNLIITCQLNKDFISAEKNIIKHFKKGDNEYSKKLLMLLGNNYYLQGKYNQAIKTYNEYREAYPDNATCYFNLGLTQLKLSDEEEALDYFLEAYNKDNKFIAAIYNIADYYYKNKDYDNSFYYFSLLENLDKKNPDIYYRLGQLEYHIEEYEHSKKHFLEAIKLDSKNSEYYISLAKVYSKGYNNRIKTLENIENALKNGFKDLKYLQSNTEFKLLNQFDEYKEMLKEYGLK